MTRDRIGLGIDLGTLAYCLFSLHDAANKWLVATLPVSAYGAVRILAGSDAGAASLANWQDRLTGGATGWSSLG